MLYGTGANYPETGVPRETPPNRGTGGAAPAHPDEQMNLRVDHLHR